MIRMRDKQPEKSDLSKGADPVNPYHVLQIRRDATPSEIRQAYRRLALWHHPGRSHESLEERQRRLQVFEILAACYETLMSSESQKRLDLLIKDAEERSLTAGLPTGEMFVGGKRLVGNSDSSTRSLLTMAEEDEWDPPPLSRVSSQSTISETHDDQLMIISCAPGDDDGNLKKLVNMSTSRSEDATEVHFTQTDTNRLFGGPLSLMYRARKWKPFTDPFVVFEQVFGSRIFHVNAEEVGRLQKWMPLRSSKSAAWMGYSNKQSDGSTVFVTSRVLHDRKLTRTETVSIDPETGLTNTVVTITAEDLEPPEEEPEPQVSQVDCLVCHRTRIRGDSADESDSDVTICADFYILYNDFLKQCRIDPEILNQTFDSDLFQCFGLNDTTEYASPTPKSTEKDCKACNQCCKLA